MQIFLEYITFSFSCHFQFWPMPRAPQQASERFHLDWKDVWTKNLVCIQKSEIVRGGNAAIDQFLPLQKKYWICRVIIWISLPSPYKLNWNNIWRTMTSVPEGAPWPTSWYFRHHESEGCLVEHRNRQPYEMQAGCSTNIPPQSILLRGGNCPLLKKKMLTPMLFLPVILCRPHWKMTMMTSWSGWMWIWCIWHCLQSNMQTRLAVIKMITSDVKMALRSRLHVSQLSMKGSSEEQYVDDYLNCIYCWSRSRRSSLCTCSFFVWSDYLVIWSLCTFQALPELMFCISLTFGMKSSFPELLFPVALT